MDNQADPTAGHGARALAWLESVGQDVRYAVRSLVSQPLFTATALLALVLGIGLNIGLFTALNAIWLRPWNVPEPDRVVQAYAQNLTWLRRFGDRAIGVGGFSYGGARYLSDHSQTVAGVLAVSTERVQVSDDEWTLDADAAFVTGNFFDVLQVGMAAGRAFRAEEDATGSPVAVAVLSHLVWTQQYAADPAVIGRTIRLDNVPFTVIGVAAEGFDGTSPSRTSVWAPLPALPLAMPAQSGLLTDPDSCCAGTVAARLRPGVSRAQAEAEWNTLHGAYSAATGSDELEITLAGTARIDSAGERAQAAPTIAVLFAAFGAVLVLACANVSNLLLARAAARRSEIAVRLAIGARRGRVMRQMLTESAALALCAAALTLPLAYLLPGLVLGFVDRAPPTNLDLTPNGTVLLYALAVAVLSAAFFGLAPAFRSTRLSLIEAMKRQGTQASPRFPLRSVLLGVQIAISVALLAAAGLLVRGLDRARSLDLGFRTDGITAIEVVLPPNAYDAARERQLFDELAERLETTGQPVAISQHTPVSFGGYTPAACFGGTTFEHPVYFQAVTPRYFELLQIPLAAGRTLLPEDRQRGGILVNETFARLCWPDRSPVGQVEKLGGVEREVVGVVRDAQLNFVGSDVPTFFESFGRNDGAARRSATIVLPSAMTAAAIAAVRALEPRAAAPVVTLDEQVRRSLGETVGVARIAGALGLLALLLAAVGVYGVVSYTVEQRRREIAVRMALGARPDQVIRLVLHGNAAALGAGLVVGFAIAAGESVFLRSLLYGLSPADPLAYGGVLLVLLLVGIAASVVPARRAVRTDPTTVLHYE